MPDAVAHGVPEYAEHIKRTAQRRAAWREGLAAAAIVILARSKERSDAAQTRG